jgi:hypothetical protein
MAIDFFIQKISFLVSFIQAERNAKSISLLVTSKLPANKNN